MQTDSTELVSFARVGPILASEDNQTARCVQQENSPIRMGKQSVRIVRHLQPVHHPAQNFWTASVLQERVAAMEDHAHNVSPVNTKLRRVILRATIVSQVSIPQSLRRHPTRVSRARLTLSH